MRKRYRARPIDKVRASRDGHEFHEAWAARKALQLLLPTDGLVGIAVEGLEPADQSKAAAATVEIADLTLYYGRGASFALARHVRIVQLKYSVSQSDVAFRCSDARKTLRKFSRAFRDHQRHHPPRQVERKLRFELITNRPILPAFQDAVDAIARGRTLRRELRHQATQFKAACGLKGKDLATFARKVTLTGLTGSLSALKRDLTRTVVDWSAARDALSRARLHDLKELVTRKAGTAGQGRNLITQIDIVAALDLQDLSELFPCPESFPHVGKVVRREQLPELAKLVPTLDKPLLIHAAGGVGKSVFLQSFVKALARKHTIVLFDCFGGGAYRAPEDRRHLPKRGLIHIVNTLAGEGLCDPLLPDNDSLEDLIVAFRKRLEQARDTLRTASPGRQIVLVLDAIDNAALQAQDKGEPCFPRLLLESFQYGGPIGDVKLVVSCRSHRRQISRGEIVCDERELRPFKKDETETYLRARIPKVTQAQIRVAHARSGGNARILEHLALSNRGLLDPTEIDKPVELDSLIRQRIDAALQEVRRRGYRRDEIGAFLAGLAVLPPPVPVREYAEGHGIEVSAVESFAADFAPLLENTRHGLMFRDEPTETLIRDTYGSDAQALRKLADNLVRRQGESVYAASALPGLLHKLDDGERLFALAFDERFPSAITSKVGQRTIRYARLKAAARHAAAKEDKNQLVHLLVELSTIAAVNQKGEDYIVENPSLVVASQDVDATRRLYEVRTRWQGTRHARLAIAAALYGDLDDAFRHAATAERWISHYSAQEPEPFRDRGGPEALDTASIPLCLIAEGRMKDAVRYLRRWRDWFAFDVSVALFALLAQLPQKVLPATVTDAFLETLTTEVGVLAASLSVLESDEGRRRDLVSRLSAACRTRDKIGFREDFYTRHAQDLPEGLLKSAVIAATLGLHADALAIMSAVPHQRPRAWTFIDRLPDGEVFSLVARVALTTLVEARDVTERDLLPRELVEFPLEVPAAAKGSDFRNALKQGLEARYKAERTTSDKEKRELSYETTKELERFVDERLDALLKLTRAFKAAVAAEPKDTDAAFLALVSTWSEVRTHVHRYRDSRKFDVFFDLLGRRAATLLLSCRSDLKRATVEKFLATLLESDIVSSSDLIDLVRLFAKRASLQELAAITAARARASIDREDEVGFRAKLHGELANAILPASVAEAAAQFRAGLEQMDAIGSGDYQFTNELLAFAASLRGAELSEQDFHTLTNICELNLTDEPEKFTWYTFSRAMSRTSGLSTLAKLCRWTDRSKVSLHYTLLPCITGLILDGKIEPEHALALLRLSSPAELWVANTEGLAHAIDEQRYANHPAIVGELIRQFIDDNARLPMGSSVRALADLAAKVLGPTSEEAMYLGAVAARSRELIDEENVRRNASGSDPRLFSRADADRERREARDALIRMLAQTNPSDPTSLTSALAAFRVSGSVYELRDTFFQTLRGNVGYPDRARYVEAIATSESLNVYQKLAELKACREQWVESSLSLQEAFRGLALRFIRLHAEDFIRDEQLSDSNLKEVAAWSGVSMSALALDFIKLFASPDWHVGASIWMGLATIISGDADAREGHGALVRLLHSGAAKLSDGVLDGPWKAGLYPTGASETEVIASMIWFRLGAPDATHRWRAAHSVRTLARLGKWETIDALVAKLDRRDAGGFQAQELKFYFLHARLWLLIALARVAKEYPTEVGRYATTLTAVAHSRELPHVLMRHFAAQALTDCLDQGALELPAATVETIRAVDASPLPRLRQKARLGSQNSFYAERPASMPEPKQRFSLDYDFDKYTVDHLSRVFGRPRWETHDRIGHWAHTFDADIKAMYETGGRDRISRRRMSSGDSRYHEYGYQLGWHGLYFTAGEFLGRYPVTDDSYDEDPWPDWLRSEVLTRRDGLWLADGMDRPPVDAAVHLLERGEKGSILTGNRAKLLALLGIQERLGPDVVVKGIWRSADGIEVSVMSALVSPRKAAQLAKQLAAQEAMLAWLPSFEKHEGGEERLINEKVRDFTAWIVQPNLESRLDEHDPFATRASSERLHVSSEIVDRFSLKPSEAFGRIWLADSGASVTQCHVWGNTREYGEERIHGGMRLKCTTTFLKHVLEAMNKDLLILLKLERYEKESLRHEGRFSHTTAVIWVRQSLELEFFAGAVNKPHEIKY